VGEQFDTTGEIDMSITHDVEHHDIDESEAICLQESCQELVEPTNLDLDDAILYVEYESFSCEFDINKSLDECFYVEYESFSFDPISTDLLFESCKSEFVESKTFMPLTFVLEQTLVHSDNRRSVEFVPTILPKPFVHYDIVSRLITHLLANFKYICLFDVRAQKFDKLKLTLTCAALTWWMYSFWHQLFTFYCYIL